MVFAVKVFARNMSQSYKDHKLRFSTVRLHFSAECIKLIIKKVVFEDNNIMFTIKYFNINLYIKIVSFFSFL